VVNTSDKQLIKLFRENGRQDALDELMRRHLHRVRSTVFQMVHNDAEADDVTQEVFLRAIRGVESFDCRAEFSTWLYRVTMNTTYSYLKRRSRSRSPVDFRSELHDPMTSADSSPDRAVLQAELLTEVDTAVASLSPTLRGAVVLVCLQGFSPAEAADIEGCSADTIHWRIHEGRRKLKRLLKEHLS
jgi:RNA polymerase sigma-70 factor (ECF subfamily)